MLPLLLPLTFFVNCWIYFLKIIAGILFDTMPLSPVLLKYFTLVGADYQVI
jgi:hypothetical protein